MTVSAPLKTSVVIPCYNAAPFVGAAIDSCLAEGVPGRQIIVVDDGSTDASPQVLAGYDSTIRVQRQHNAGASKARNAGLALVETDYVVFLDADDVYENGFLGALEAKMALEKADLGLGPQQRYRENTRFGALQTPPQTHDLEAFVAAWLSGHTVGTNSHMWRTAFLRELGGWREDMKTLEEIEVVLRAALSGARLVVSTTGHARYIDRPDIARVSHGNSENVIRSALDGFAHIEASLISDAQRKALGRRYYQQARSAFRQGYTSLGREALARARACGLRGHVGTRAHKLLASVLGLEVKEGWSGSARG